eukprot:maker-scaffold133_size323035-snap-gene-1.15 protein:Tk02239 transcript:maker-scaffold133_size323035-snap-gene-1.15-mRNA-1 annotation:"hypothetical protein F443_12346"
MDVEKLKVTELRTELASRGLDTKGIKSVLVARLKTAQEADPEATASGNGTPEPEVVGAAQVEAVEVDEVDEEEEEEAEAAVAASAATPAAEATNGHTAASASQP